MTILDENTVVVTTADELKTVLTGQNTYDYLYFGANITLTSGITIAPTKTNVTIDGTYQGVRFTYEDRTSTGSGDTISVRNAAITQVTVQNINVIGHNYYGIIYVPEENALRNVVITYQNITYTGPQITFHPTGLSRYIDCHITIQTSYSPSNEVAECNRIEMGGNTTIVHTTTGDSMFWFRGTVTPYFKILSQATVTLTSQARELFYGVTNLAFQVAKGASFSLTSYYGMGYANYATNQVLIEEDASVSITQTGQNGAYPTWYCNGPFIIKENASLEVINTASSLSSSNYNLAFLTSSASFTLTNPKKIILYNKVADVIHTDSTIPFTFTYTRLNLWTKAESLTIAGTLQDLPTYHWIKGTELSNVSGTFSATNTTIQTNNYTADELANLPSLTNFSFQGKPVFSIGSFKLNIDALTDQQTKIKGYTSPDAEVQITDPTKRQVVTANQDGVFEGTLDAPLPIGTMIHFLANVPFLYQEKTIQIVYPGDLTLDSAPKTISFVIQPFSTNPVLCPRSQNDPITITDTRISGSEWKLYATIQSPLTSPNGFVLTDSLVFRGSDQVIIPLSTTPTLIYTGPNNQGTTLITNVSYPEEEGILLRVENEPMENMEEYQTTIDWTLEE